jgi:enoyl-CoA hydratase
VDNESSNLVVARKVDLPTPGTQACILELNRPDDMNPLDWSTIRALRAELDAADQDPAVRAILLTGRGRAFSAGGDLRKYLEIQRDTVKFPQLNEEFHALVLRLGEVSKPTIALVNGTTAAGGLEVLLGCDFAFAGRSARIGDGHLNFGQMGGGGVLTLLPRLIGPNKARELIFSGRLLRAEEALDWGLVNRVVDDADLEKEGLAFAAQVAAHSPLAVANAKYVLNNAWKDGTGVIAGMRVERERTAYYCLTSFDAREGLEAFDAKRKPAFKGT